MLAWPLIALVAWLVAAPPVSTQQPVRVSDVQWCRMPPGLGEGPALLVRFEVERDWHMSWMNPGDSGAPPTAKATLPAGWRLGQPVWPRPRVQRTDGETLFVHEGTWGWLIPVVGGSDGAVPDFPVELDLGWMVCRQSCALGKTTMRVPPPPRTLPACPPDVGGSVFPVRLLEGDLMQVQGDRLHLRCQARGRMSARFVQATDPGVQLEEGNPVEVAVKDGVAELETRLLVRAQDADGHALAIRGVLLLGDGPRDPCVWVERKLPVQAIPPGAAP